MRIFIIISLCLFLFACTSDERDTSGVDIIATLPVSTARPTANPSSTPLPTHTIAISPSPTEIPSPTLTPTSSLTPTPVGGGSGLIAFSSDGENGWDIYTSTIDGHSIQRLTSLEESGIILNVSPNGEWILFFSGDINAPFYRLYAVRIDGKEIIKISDHFYHSNSFDYTFAHWTADSSAVVYIEYQGYNQRYLSMFNFKERKSYALSEPGSSAENIKIISRDGWIHWESEFDSGGKIFSDDFRTNFDGSTTNEKASAPCEYFFCRRDWTYSASSNVVASADIVFEKAENNQDEVKVIITISSLDEDTATDGTTVIKLGKTDFTPSSSGAVDIGSPTLFVRMSLSPDGNRLLIPIFGDRAEYFLWSREDNSVRALPEEFTSGGSHQYYSWSPDGNYILFSGNILLDTRTLETRQILTKLGQRRAYYPKWVP